MTHGSLFSGIGGFDLAAEWMGWENKFHCEINEFCNHILNYYWPHAKSYKDIKTTDFNVWRGKIDVLSGGFPCQPYSSTGRRKGKSDDRHLWPQMLRAAKEIQPSWITGENVPGITNWSKGMVVKEIKTDLEGAGFTLLPPIIIPACAINADHRRDRVWFIAYSNSKRCEGKQQQVVQKSKQMEKPTETLAAYSSRKKFTNFLPEPKTISRTNGIPLELDGITFSKWREETTKGFGNAIVPGLGYEIFKTIEQYEKESK